MPSLLSKKHQNRDIVYKLTALWALSESGIGGFMFAFKIPLTGLLLGANAIILLTMIAYYSDKKFSEILRATLLVLIVKVLVSPHSSPTAYLAVGFQGLAAALLFSNIKSLKLAAVLLGAISMLESATQKLLLLTIVFGKELWEAVNLFFEHISKELKLDVSMNYAYWIITIYLLLFAIWGIVVGRFAASLPLTIDKRKKDILKEYYLSLSEKKNLSLEVNRSSSSKFWIISFGLLFAIILLAFSYYFPNKAWWLLGRTIVILFLFYFLIVPFTRWLAQRWLKSRKGTDVSAAKELIKFLPEVRQYVEISYKMSAKYSSFVEKAKAFMTNTIIITLYAGASEKHDNI